jgi:asparagine synthase (glutamine-hydrolysing)
MRAVVDATGVRASFTHPTGEDLLAELERLVWHQDEPFGSTSIFAQWSVFQLVARAGVKVVLDGQGADEQLAGYTGFSLYYLAELLRKRALVALAWESWRYSRFQNIPPTHVWRSLVALNSRRLATSPRAAAPEWIDRGFAAAHADSDFYDAYSRLEPFGGDETLNNLLFQMTFHNNLPSLLRYEDRNSMAFSVEARVPFLDHRLVEFVFSLPSSLKIRNGYTKWVLRSAMAGLIPEKVSLRVSKLGFATPERRWQQTILRPLLSQALASEQLRGAVNQQAAERYFGRISAEGKKDFTPWRWINLYLWGRAHGVA